MPYAPTVNDNSGQILSQASQNAAAIQLQSMQNLGNSIAKMGDSLNDAYKENIKRAQENAQKADTNLGTGDAIESIYKTYGTPEQLDDFLVGRAKASNNQDRLAGFYAMHVPTAHALVQLDKSTKLQNAQYNSALRLAQQKQALGVGSGGSNPTFAVDIADGVDIYR